MSSNVRTPKWWAALIPFVVLVGTMVFVIAWFGGDAITGPSQLALLFSAAVAVAMGMRIYKVSWKSIEASISSNIREVGVALVILVLIGAISGTWMISGVVPWNSCGVTQATVLRVPTMEYLPYCIFNIVSPLVDLLVVAIGYKVFSSSKASETGTSAQSGKE